MKTLLKLWLLVACVGLCVAWALWPRTSLPTSSKPPAQLVLATTLDVDHPYNQQLLAGIEAALVQTEGMTIKTLILPDSATDQAHLLRQFTFQPGDRLLLHSEQAQELAETLHAWAHQGVAITLLDSPLAQASSFPIAGWSPYQQGQRLAQTTSGDSRKPVALLYQAGHPTSLERLVGAQAQLDVAGRPYVQLALGEDKLANQALAEEFFATYPQAQEVVLLDEASSRQLARYLKQGLKRAHLYGIGYHLELWTALEAGDLTANLAPNPYALGFQVARLDNAARADAPDLYQVIEVADLFNPANASWLFPIE